MADVYSGHSQFVLLTNNSTRRRWFDGRTVFLITIVSFPIIIFCGIYTVILKNNETLMYPKSNLNVPPPWTHRAKIYSTHPKTHTHKLAHLITNIPESEPDEFKLICYYNFPPPNNSDALTPDKIDPFLCTHINVAFATISNNSIALDQSELAVIKSLISLKQTNPKLKILLSVGGSGNACFSDMVQNHASRKWFIKSVMEHVRRHEIDGIDLDWEFPNSNRQEQMHFAQLLLEFRHTIDKQTRHKFLLSVAVAAPVSLIDTSYDVPYMNRSVDFINVMTYDYHFYTRFTPFTGLNSPLYPSSRDRGYLATLNINYTINYWIAKGMDRDKIVVGLPTYGHTFRLTNTHNNGLYAPARGYGKLGSDGFADYSQICKFLNINQVRPVFDMDTKSPYATKSSEWVSFEDVESLSFKAEFVRDQRLGGAMIYSLNTDDYLGVCEIDPKVPAHPFPLTTRVHEVLDRNYSIF